MQSREALQHLPLFRGAEPADLDALAAVAQAQSYGPGEQIFDHGHPADALFAIVIGTVEIVAQGQDVAVVSLASGQGFGDVAFFRRAAHTAAARAREATRVLRIPFAELDRLLAERPGLALIFYRNAANSFAHHLGQIAAEIDRPYL
jgi:CRP/FNR family cyclic AMP-dependent transcriptional regulator